MGLFSISLPLQVRAATPDAGAPPDASAPPPPPSTELHCGEGESSFRYRISIVNSDHTFTRRPAEETPVCRRPGQAPDDSFCPADHRLVTYMPGEGGNAAHLLCEPRSTSAPTPATTADAGTTGTGGTSSGSTPATSTDPNAQLWAGRLRLALGGGWRGFGNHRDDPHDGFIFSLTFGVPRINFSNFFFEPFVSYRHEEMGRNIQIVNPPGPSMRPAAGPRSSAQIDALGIGFFLGWHPSEWFEMALGGDIGGAHLSARADPTGEMSGLLVGAGTPRGTRSLALFTSADTWAVDLNARLFLAVPDHRIACSPVSIGGGAEAFVGYNPFSIRPDWAHDADRDIAVSSVHGGLLLFLRATIDGGTTCSSPAPSSSGDAGSSDASSSGDAGASTDAAASDAAPADAGSGDASTGDAASDASRRDGSTPRSGPDGGAPADADAATGRDGR